MSEGANDLVEAVARAISPYGWNDAYWQAEPRAGHYDRNQRHVQETARDAARAALSAIVRSGKRIVDL